MTSRSLDQTEEKDVSGGRWQVLVGGATWGDERVEPARMVLAERLQSRFLGGFSGRSPRWVSGELGVALVHRAEVTKSIARGDHTVCPSLNPFTSCLALFMSHSWPVVHTSMSYFMFAGRQWGYDHISVRTEDATPALGCRCLQSDIQRGERGGRGRGSHGDWNGVAALCFH